MVHSATLGHIIYSFVLYMLLGLPYFSAKRKVKKKKIVSMLILLTGCSFMNPYPDSRKEIKCWPKRHVLLTQKTIGFRQYAYECGQICTVLSVVMMHIPYSLNFSLRVLHHAYVLKRIKLFIDCFIRAVSDLLFLPQLRVRDGRMYFLIFIYFLYLHVLFGLCVFESDKWSQF